MWRTSTWRFSTHGVVTRVRIAWCIPMCSSEDAPRKDNMVCSPWQTNVPAGQKTKPTEAVCFVRPKVFEQQKWLHSLQLLSKKQSPSPPELASNSWYGSFILSVLSVTLELLWPFFQLFFFPQKPAHHILFVCNVVLYKCVCSWP